MNDVAKCPRGCAQNRCERILVNERQQSLYDTAFDSFIAQIGAAQDQVSKRHNDRRTCFRVGGRQKFAKLRQRAQVHNMTLLLLCTLRRDAGQRAY